MTMYWIYDLPNWLFGLLTILVFNAIAIGGLIATRPVARRLLKESGEHNDVVSWIFAAVGVFYGLAMGLIAVGTWEDFTEVDALVGKEAASLAGLYRDFDGYPPDLRSKFEGQLRDYAKQIVAVEWPKHRQGLAPDDGGEQLDALENDIMAFEPKLEREKITHAQVLHGLDDVIEVRRARMQAVGTGLPAALWAVVVIGVVRQFSCAGLSLLDRQPGACTSS